MCAQSPTYTTLVHKKKCNLLKEKGFNTWLLHMYLCRCSSVWLGYIGFFFVILRKKNERECPTFRIFKIYLWNCLTNCPVYDTFDAREKIYARLDFVETAILHRLHFYWYVI